MNDEKWMCHALALADKARKLGEVPVGAVLIDAHENILGEGWNQPISDHDPTAHAEVIALRAAGKRVKNYRLPGTTLYVTIEPCLMCAGAMIHSRIERLVFGALEPKAGVVVSQNNIFDKHDVFNHRIQYTQGVLAERCSSEISEFFRARRAVKKIEKKEI